jgi:hypothetical protein
MASILRLPDAGMHPGFRKAADFHVTPAGYASIVLLGGLVRAVGLRLVLLAAVGGRLVGDYGDPQGDGTGPHAALHRAIGIGAAAVTTWLTTRR